jgi:hypothetical protein
MTNYLFQPVDFKIDQTRFGTWRQHLNESGSLFREFTSHASMFGLPLLHYTAGRNPETGRRKIAKGIFAIGRIAIGVFPVGQMAIGLCPIGQLSLGLVFGIGQLATGVFAIGQCAIGVLFGAGQLATGVIAVGQFALGGHVLAQRGFGRHVWDTVNADPAARDFFKRLLNR